MIFKQIAVGIGIAILLPLFVYYGASLLSPSADWTDFYAQNYLKKKQEAKTPKQRHEFAVEENRRRDALKTRDKNHQRMIFYVAYPVGIVAIIGGAFVAAPAVGAGFMFGGIFTLTTGCGVYWDKMSDALHFGALAIALIAIISLGIWKIRPQPSQKGGIVS